MTPRARIAVFGAGAVMVGCLLVWAYAGLPAFGHYRGPYGDAVSQAVGSDRRITETVAAVTFDYRGIDTLGEELILLACVVGVAVLLRQQRDEVDLGPPPGDEEGRHVAMSDTVRFWSLAAIGPTAILGFGLVGHGHLTPGGGFQGGVVLASAGFLAYLGGHHRAYEQAVPPGALEPLEGLGAGTYVIIGLVGLWLGSAFLDNVLPLGTSGVLPSGGMIPLLNVAVGIEVAAGIMLLLHENLQQVSRPELGEHQ